MLRVIDAVSRLFGTVAGWAYFATALMLGYEVVMRYVFIAPTIWAEELSRMLLVWATFGGAAILLHRRQHITITLLTDMLSPRLRQVQEVFVLLFIAALAAVIVRDGGGIAWDSFQRGRTTGSMLNLPAWWAQVSLPLCFALLGLQALVEALRVATGGAESLPRGSVEH
ncbi:TRAP transporter small permease [Stappia sp. TSB10P1A]|uniref:TRAP transporter small permease n=1 Tax=Stappia sp. TSB10P1A TaxID=2003585 RepID=UPI001643CD72|nr:TRAP transporter small permease [Stappia sp. TSB10P1A]